MIASDVSWSGSPAVTNVTSAGRPSFFSAAKRRSMRVVTFQSCGQFSNSVTIASSAPSTGYTLELYLG